MSNEQNQLKDFVKQTKIKKKATVKETYQKQHRSMPVSFGIVA